MASDEETSTINLLAPSAERLASTKVFPLIHQLRSDVQQKIDTTLTWEQLNASDINFALVRPVVQKYARQANLASIYAVFVVRAHCLARAEDDLANAGVWSSRAMFAELLAVKLLRRFAINGAYELVAALTTSWDPLAGATEAQRAAVKDIIKDEDDMFQPASALEAAISTKSKYFLSSALVQKVIYDIWAGNIEFSTISNRAVLRDNYKTRQIEFYDCRKGPILNHYRLRVPKYGAILEFLNFAMLFVTFLLCVSTQNLEHLTLWEVVFGVMAIAFALEEYTAAQEHGLNIYMANMWNGFDTAIITLFLFYAGYRTKGLVNDDLAASDLAFDILACEALILFPRIAFFALSDNIIIIALQGMIKEFCFFIFLAMICFSGLLFTLWKLGRRSAGKWTVSGIAWLMVQIWFGNTYLSFQQAKSFHEIFGPILMVLFAALANTLLITILISILSNTFARIDSNATQEYLFQFAVTTMEGIKGDALFCYQPPFNLLAYSILYPASFILDARTFHRLNVLLMRITCFPILLVITVYERYFARGQKWRESGHDVGQTIVAALPRSIKYSALFEAILGSQSNDLLDAIFEVDVHPESTAEEDDGTDDRPLLRSYASRETFNKDSPYATPRNGNATPTRSRQSEPTTPMQAHMTIPSTRSDSDSRGRSASRTRDVNLTVDLVSRPSDANNSSPLARLFARRPVSEAFATHQVDNVTRRIEQVADSLKDLHVHRLKDEMKELQERQARIENLLMTLTRGMRADTSVTPSASVRR
ncbi:receptor-activated Ca2+-permeable cation channel [Auricularia subglabra TFB-10046 SS5]|nr:receptor-activated Ca2+-permeable cation channel [Auricularia subglabra TFB-10046 SS5]